MRHLTSLLVLTVSAFGCAKQADVKDYIPADEVARQALTTALDAWKAGKSPDQVEASKPAVSVQDKQWSGGAKLTAYEIVGPATGDDQHRRFTVKLTLAGAAAPQETTYVVFGKDPLWVMSGESYERMSGM
ncbi:MAG TPA: hypothetical protein VFI31_04575 [Pirellulales bacterium]|nr:hypothetical protein [Pirellulales bacterium]